MNNQTQISVIMPVYNAGKYVKDAIKSILNQTFRDFEFLIINDGSTDNSKEIILSFSDNRIRYIENEKNLRLIKTLNKGLKLATGKYVARMDADDVALPNRFSKQFSFLEMNTDVVVCGSYIRYFDGAEKSNIRWIKHLDHDIKKRLYSGACFAHPSVMIRKKILDEHKLFYNEKYKHAEDYKLWCDLSNHGKFYNIPEILLNYRISESQISSKENKSQKLCTHIIRKELIEGLFNSAPSINKFKYPNEIKIADVVALFKTEAKLKKHSQAWYNKNKTDISAVIMSYISSIERADLLSLTYVFIRCVFRIGFDFVEFARLCRRSIF